MKPAEIVTAVVAIPVVAAFLVSAMTDRVAPQVPAAITAETPSDFAQNVADEIVIVAKRAVADAPG